MDSTTPEVKSSPTGMRMLPGQTKAGWIEVEQGIIKTWKKRFVVLQGSDIIVYKDSVRRFYPSVKIFNITIHS